MNECIGEVNLDRFDCADRHVSKVNHFGEADLDLEVGLGVRFEFQPQDVVIHRLDLDFVVLNLVSEGGAHDGDGFTGAGCEVAHFVVLELEDLADGLHHNHPGLLDAHVGHLEVFADALGVLVRSAVAPDEDECVRRQFNVFLD